jgi:hypothetical protein
VNSLSAPAKDQKLNNFINTSILRTFFERKG